MQTSDYILNDIQPLDYHALMRDAREVFKHLTYSHLPVEKDGVFIGSLSENDAYCFEGKRSISDFDYAIEPFHVVSGSNWMDVLKAFATHNCNVIPVLDEENKYLGYYELADIMGIFNETPFLNEAGGIIVIEKEAQEYSFSEICQIVESNGSHIYGIFISKHNDNTVEITLKIGREALNSVVQTFRRYNYRVISQHNEDRFLRDLKERSEYLDKYLNI